MRAKLFVALVGRFSGGKAAIFARQAGFIGRLAPFFGAAASRRQGRGRKQGAMIAPYDPRGTSAVVVAGDGGVFSGGDGRIRKIDKGMMIIPLNPRGFFAAGGGRGGGEYLANFRELRRTRSWSAPLQ